MTVVEMKAAAELCSCRTVQLAGVEADSELERKLGGEDGGGRGARHHAQQRAAEPLVVRVVA